jgi:hypothetical protein
MTQNIAPLQQVINRYRFDTYRIHITLTDPISGAPLNLTSCSAVLTINSLQNPPDNTTQVAQLTGTVTAGAGTIDFPVDPTTSQKPAATYFYDIKLTDATGTERCLVSGEYRLFESVTKA